MERKGVVALRGQPLILLGNEVKIRDKAPDFTCLDKDLKEVSLADFSGKIKVISVTPSLDTPVCDLQARRFNEEAAALPQSVVFINISVDLPFAISRFCQQTGINNMRTLSDHRETSFGTAYGVLIKGLRLLTRAIFVIDKDNVIRYMEIVPEVSQPPDYERALKEVKKLLA